MPHILKQLPVFGANHVL